MQEINYRPWLNVESLKGSDIRINLCIDDAKKNWHVPPHCHEHYEVVFYHHIKTKAVIDGKDVALQKGDCIILPPYCLHQFEIESGSHAYACIHLDAGMVDRLTPPERSLEEPLWRKLPDEELTRIWSLIELHHQASSQGQLKDKLEKSLLYWLFENVLTLPAVESWKSTPFKKLLVYLDQHRLFHFKAEDAASFLGYSRPHFMNRFKKQFRLNYNDFLTQRQIHWARQLLSSSKLSVESISRELGFKNPSYFIRVFKKITHTTPVQYRKNLILTEEQ